MIGRDRELADVVARIDARRLVTIIGAGGIGKTTLARAAASHVADRFEMGAHFVDLTRIDSPDDVGGAIAAQLGFSSFESLLESPSETPALVVVDNCEHVIDAAATAISALLDACSAPTVVATSRSPLDIDGESVLVLGPLAVPMADGGADPEADSVRLFYERARDAGVPPSDDQLDDIAELCRQLDGVPLAIELAAARTRSMTPAELVKHLREGDDVLTRPRFRGTPRHRSLRETIDWSRRQLDNQAAALFDRLGVFAGPFTVEAAAAIQGAAGATRLNAVRDTVSRLVDASLLVAERQGPESWYRMLSPIRAFAAERLNLAGDLIVVEDRFTEHVVATAVEIADASRTGWSMATMRRLLGLYDNVAAALRWCLGHDDTLERAGTLYGVLWGIVHQAHTDDIAVLGREVMERWPDLPPPRGPDVAATLATAEYLLGRPDVAVALAERALPDAAASDFAPATLRRVLGQSARALGDNETAIEMFAAAARHAEARRLPALTMEVEVFRAQVLADMGHTDEALAITRSTRRNATGSDVIATWARATEGHVVLRRDPAAAIPIIEEALDAARSGGYPILTSAGLRSLATAFAAEGRLAEAAATVVEMIDALLARGALSSGRIVLDVSALVLHRAGREVWVDIAATAGALPTMVLMSGVGHEPYPLPAHEGGRVLDRKRAILLARRELEEVATASAEVDDASKDAPAPDAQDDAALTRTGAVWEVRFAGRSVHVKASKGMDDLGRLLGHPGTEVHCLELAGAGVESATTGEVIDDVARRRYEQRVRELQGDIDAAEADHDLGRAEHARLEMDTLVDHLAAALGLSGKTRQTGGTAERARSAVTQRLRSTIRRITQDHPELGRHLTVSITTGTFCSYHPEHPVHWRIDVA